MPRGALQSGPSRTLMLAAEKLINGGESNSPNSATLVANGNALNSVHFAVNNCQNGRRGAESFPN